MRKIEKVTLFLRSSYVAARASIICSLQLLLVSLKLSDKPIFSPKFTTTKKAIFMYFADLVYYFTNKYTIMKLFNFILLCIRQLLKLIFTVKKQKNNKLTHLTPSTPLLKNNTELQPDFSYKVAKPWKILEKKIGSGALSGNMLLVWIIENANIWIWHRRVRAPGID